jgi:hypothetical protein
MIEPSDSVLFYVYVIEEQGLLYLKLKILLHIQQGKGNREQYKTGRTREHKRSVLENIDQSQRR